MRIARAITSFTRTEIQQLFARAYYLFSDTTMTIKRAPKAQEIGRVLIVVPKRVGNAPTRNTIKRRVRAIFYQNQLYERGNDYLIFFKANPLSFAYLKEKLCTLL